MPDRSTHPSEAAFHILLALAQGERHGYAIIQELEAGGVRMGPGTLYSALKRLIEYRWIEEVASPTTSDTRRRYYRITRAGRSVLRQEAERLAALIDRAVSTGVLPQTRIAYATQ
jgi:DNA-binding PadR family transcriptional regulator